MKIPISFHQHHAQVVTITLGLWTVIAVFSALLYALGPSQLPLWYSRVQSAEQLADRSAIAAIPALASVIVLLTLWYGRRTQLDHEEYMASLSLWSGNFLLVFLLLSLLRIMKVVL